MTIPMYDYDVLPCITDPMKVTQEETERFLGGRALTGAVYAEINLIADTDAEEKALYDFWKDQCKYGVEPFLISLPIFGNTFDITKPDILVQFVGEISGTRDGGRWTSKQKLKVLGTLAYTVDDQGNFIVTDAGAFVVTEGGDYVATGNAIESYREVLY